MWYKQSLKLAALSPDLNQGHKATSQSVLEYIDANTKAHLNLPPLRQKLNEEGKYWVLGKVNPAELIINDKDNVDWTAYPLNNKPIVIDDKKVVIDGRHRALRALYDGVTSLRAWMPYHSPV